MTRPITKPVIEFVLAQAKSDLYGAYCRNRLMDLLEGAGPNAEARESDATAVIENELRQLLPNDIEIERQPIRPAPGAAVTESSDDGHLVARLALPTANDRPLLFIIDDPGLPTTGSVPRSTADRVCGTGATGSKTQVALSLAVLKLLGEVKERFGLTPVIPIEFRFPYGRVAPDAVGRCVAASRHIKGCEAVILTATGGIPHIGQPGMVPFTCRVSSASPVDVFPFVVQAIDIEGLKLRNECRDATGAAGRWLAATQTNHGIMADYGIAPWIACDRVSIRVRIVANANPERIAMRMAEVMDATLVEYLRHRTDLTRQPDPATGEPKLKRHYALSLEPATDVLKYRVDVFGRRACLGTPAEADSAISKAAFLFAALLRVRRSFPNVRAEAALADVSPGRPANEVIIQGVQTFGPPHDAAAIRRRLTAAAQAGFAQCRELGGAAGANVAISFDGPEREPFEQATPGAAFEALRSAFDLASLPPPNPSPWPGLSCGDSVAAAGHPTAIFGAGRLDRSATEHESVEIPHIQQTLAIATLAALTYQPADRPL